MLSLSHVTAAQAENYYEKDDYYTQDSAAEEGQINRSGTQWYGHGAKILGLEGAVNPQIFKDLLHGQSPQGDCLHGRPIDPTKHRAATDYTFSAPKSVSIAGLIQQDDRVIAAHEQAVATALSVLESRYAQTRITTPEGRQRIRTHNITAAIFRHETSREQDPQLHSHCVVINTTQAEDGSWRSLSNEEIIANQKLLGEIYQNDLAYQLRQVGYTIQPQANGQFELAGYSPALLNTFSSRSQQIKDYIKKWEQRLDAVNGAPLHPTQKKQATLNTRQAKQVLPRDVLCRIWAEAIQSQAIELPVLPETVGESDREFDREQAVNFVSNGIDHASEREAVFRRSKVERFILENHLGQRCFGDVQTAIDQHPELISADRLQDKFTTQTAIQREREMIALMQQGQQQVNPIVTQAAIERILLEFPDLTSGQRDAIARSTTTTDRIIAWQGVAGAGKTYSLKLYAELAIDAGFTVRGFAPSAAASAVLGQEAGIPSSTVAHLLNAQTKPDRLLGKEIWIVDEAGLLSTKDAHALLQKASAQQARLILVGDTRQLAAVEAGNPFRSLQAAGMTIAYLNESRRQKTEDLKAAVALMADGQVEQSLQKMEQTGMIQATPEHTDRLIQDYLRLTEAERSQTLILAGTNQSRQMLTAEIRRALQRKDLLEMNRCPLTILRAKDLTIAQASYAHNYAISDVLIPTRTYPRQGLQKNQKYLVVGIDSSANQLIVQTDSQEILTIDLAYCQRKSVYTVQQIPITVGDQLRWTKNYRANDIQNGQRFTIREIDAVENAEIIDEQGNIRHVNLSGQQHLDYAWVSTVYGSQGQTADRVLVALDHTFARESLYVAMSRAKHHLTLYTPDKTALTQRATVSRTKENASDYIPLFQMVNHHAAPPQSHQILANRHDRNVGEHLGNRIAASLTTHAPGTQPPHPRKLEITTTVNRLSRSTNALHRTLATGISANPYPSIPDASGLTNIAAAIRPRVHAERLGYAVGEIGAVIKQLEYRDANQYQSTTENLRLLGELESTIESQQHELQQARRHAVLSANDLPQIHRPVKKTTQTHRNPPQSHPSHELQKKRSQGFEMD
jgi:conjugative relaxase-like TrwC/TraI family protein